MEVVHEPTPLRSGVLRIEREALGNGKGWETSRQVACSSCCTCEITTVAHILVLVMQTRPPSNRLSSAFTIDRHKLFPRSSRVTHKLGRLLSNIYWAMCFILHPSFLLPPFLLPLLLPPGFLRPPSLRPLSLHAAVPTPTTPYRSYHPGQASPRKERQHVS